MLRFTNIILKLISDIEMYQFVESTIKVVISMICKRCTEANKSTSCIIYLDLKSFYGHSMIYFLPTEMLDWVNPNEFNQNNYSNDSPTGFS